MRPDVALFNDDAALGVVDRMHSVDDLLDLAEVEVLHEVVAEDCVGQQLRRPASRHHETV